MINHTVLDALRSYVDKQGLIGSTLMDADVEGMAEAVDAALNPPVPGFSDETVVEVTDDNTAHAIMNASAGKWACDLEALGPSFGTVTLAMREGKRLSRNWKRMRWAQVRAWPCQTCVSQMQGYMP